MKAFFIGVAVGFAVGVALLLAILVEPDYRDRRAFGR
jgi:hypothetical protein